MQMKLIAGKASFANCGDLTLPKQEEEPNSMEIAAEQYFFGVASFITLNSQCIVLDLPDAGTYTTYRLY